MSAPGSIEEFFDIGTDVTPSKWGGASNRRQEWPEGQMLIDRLLSFAGLELQYPPRDASELHKWVSTLNRDAVDLDELQRHALRLYLLLDLEDVEQRAEAYAHRFFMPSNYVAAIKGYWHLDNGDYADAVSCLARPGVDIDLPLLPIIVEMLSTNAPRELVRFMRIARSQLTEHLTPQDYSRIVKALAEAGQVSESFGLLRRVVDQQPQELQEQELRTQMTMVLQTILGVNTTGQPVPVALRQLLHQPLSIPEDQCLCDAVNAPMDVQLPATASDLLLDLVINRLVAQGRHLEALRLLKTTAIKPSTTDAARRRSLLFKSLKSVLTEVDLSVLSLDPDNQASDQQDDQSMTGEDVDMGQHPWAPQDEQAEEAPAARSLAEAQKNAQSRTKALKEAAESDRKNAPLSASPALRRARKMDPNGSSEAANHLVEGLKLAAMSKSPSHFQLTRSPSISRQGSPAASASRPAGHSRAPGSPFVSRPASTLRNETPRTSRTPAPQAALQLEDVSMLDNTFAEPSLDSPVVHKPRHRGKPAHINIKIPPTPKVRAAESKSKRPAPQPQEDAGPSKVQALEPDTTVTHTSDLPLASTPKTAPAKQRKKTRIQSKSQEPQRTKKTTSSSKSSRLPGYFDMDVEGPSDDDDFWSRRTESDAASENEDDEDNDTAEPFSALTQTSSIRKPRHIRANAPEPPTPAQPIPTPRRSARLSASVSREPSVDSVVSNSSATGQKRRGGGAHKLGSSKSRGGRKTRSRRAESLVEEDEEE